MMRVYLPATVRTLADVLRDGEAGPAPVRAFAVTPALRESYASGDLEELEYVAMLHAARASLRLLLADPSAPRRRVVLAADVPDDQVDAKGGFDEPTLVQVSGPVPLARVASGQIDDLVAVEDIGAAAAACPRPTPAMTTRSSWWTARKGTSCSGTRPRNSGTSRKSNPAHPRTARNGLERPRRPRTGSALAS